MNFIQVKTRMTSPYLNENRLFYLQKKHHECETSADFMRYFCKIKIIYVLYMYIFKAKHWTKYNEMQFKGTCASHLSTCVIFIKYENTHVHFMFEFHRIAIIKKGEDKNTQKDFFMALLWCLQFFTHIFISRARINCYHLLLYLLFISI